MFKKQPKVILHPMSGHVSPGECLAIMGPSGAGKTSLLNILAQRVKASSGEITVNGQNVGKSFRALSAFVQQDDVLLGNLTVREVMRYAALLRLDERMPLSEKMGKIDEILDELGLTKCADTVIGTPGIKKGISGGERKRLSIALELLTEPSVLFLDEPTTGLDAKTALNVMETIVKIAKKGRAVVLTIHQPRSDIFRLFDRLLLLARGKIAYFGPANKAMTYFASLPPLDESQPEMFQCPDEYNPADYFIDLITESTYLSGEIKDQKSEDNKRINYILEQYHEMNTYVKPELDEQLDSNLRKFSSYRSSWITQFMVILSRSFLNVIRDRVLTFSRLMQQLIMGLIVGFIFYRIGYGQKNVQDRSGVLFFVMLNQAMGTLFSSMIVFLNGEMNVFLRERGSKTYKVSSYFLGKTLAEVPNLIILPIINSAITYWLCNLNPAVDRFFMFMLIIIMVNITAQGLGTLIASFAPNTNVANALAPIIVTLLMLFGGLYINVDNIPNYLIWVYWTSMFHFAYEALTLNEFRGAVFKCPDEPASCMRPTGESVIKSLSMTSVMSNIWINLALMMALNIAYRILAYLCLKYLRKPKGG